MYGVNNIGGPNGVGSVFEMTQNADGTWRESEIIALQGIPTWRESLRRPDCRFRRQSVWDNGIGKETALVSG